jgi:hypothetical protein
MRERRECRSQTSSSVGAQPNSNRNACVKWLCDEEPTASASSVSRPADALRALVARRG